MLLPKARKYFFVVGFVLFSAVMLQGCHKDFCLFNVLGCVKLAHSQSLVVPKFGFAIWPNQYPIDSYAKPLMRGKISQGLMGVRTGTDKPLIKPSVTRWDLNFSSVPAGITASWSFPRQFLHGKEYDFALYVPAQTQPGRYLLVLDGVGYKKDGKEIERKTFSTTIAVVDAR